MKKLLASVLLFFATVALAEPFKLDFDRTANEDLYVKYNEKDWEFISHQDNWSLYLARGDKITYKNHVIMHTMIVYDTNSIVTSKITGERIFRIFNAGDVDCASAKVSIMNDFFTAEDHKVIWINSFEYGEFVAEMSSKTPRNTIYKLLCTGDSI